MDRPPRGLPQRVHFITDSDRGYTLTSIRRVPGSDIIYSELAERPTDDHQLAVLPAVAIMRTADDLPAVGREFTPEIVSDLIRGTGVLRTGVVEFVSEDLPKGLLDERLRAQIAGFFAGVLTPGDCAALRERLRGLVQYAADEAARRERASIDQMLTEAWIGDLAAARRVIDEIDAAGFRARRGEDARRA
jgi:hypothetical protein